MDDTSRLTNKNIIIEFCCNELDLRNYKSIVTNEEFISKFVNECLFLITKKELIKNWNITYLDLFFIEKIVFDYYIKQFYNLHFTHIKGTFDGL